MSDILQKINEKYDSLTLSHKKVANYILENINMIAFDSLDDLMIKIGVSTTTIIRFARLIGYSGYSEMQQDIRENIKDKVSLPERLSKSTNSVKQEQLLIDSFNNDISNLKDTIAGLSEKVLKKATNMIINSKSIYVLGLRGSFSLAHYMASRLGQIRENVRLVQAVGLIYPEETVSATEGDLCIVYMFPRYPKTTANLINWMRKRGVKIIIITSELYTSIESLADIILPCSVKGISFKDSFVAPMWLTNYIVASVANDDYDGAMGVLSKIEDILSQGYYLGL